MLQLLSNEASLSIEGMLMRPYVHLSYFHEQSSCTLCTVLDQRHTIFSRHERQQ